jgi:hypothetical protein
MVLVTLSEMADREGAMAAKPRDLERWTIRWHAALAASRKKGQRDDTRWGPGRVVIGPPAKPDEVAAVERSSGMPMPITVRRLFLTARSVEAVWLFADSDDGPPPFRGIFAGECVWSLDRMPDEIDDYRRWVSEVFPDRDNPYDAVWHGKYPLLRAANDDRIAIDGEGRVRYLSHDDGWGHGRVLGRDVFDFLEAWTRLGCPGPEDWQWLPFVAPDGEGLDPDGDNGRTWREWFGLPF